MRSLALSLTLLIALALAAGCAQQSETGDQVEEAEEPREMAWKVHEMDRPRPPRIEPAPQSLPVPPPPEAVVLFGGDDLSAWTNAEGGEAAWNVEDDYFEVAPGEGPIRTRESFGDVQLHVEWAAPDPPEHTGQDRGNSGIFFMGRYEVQILDSYEAETYADGQAGAIYGQYPPRFNVTRPPGEWQSYDIYFRRPRFGEGGDVVEPARLTVVHNGIVIQDNVELLGPTQWLKYTPYEEHEDALPIRLQDHDSPVRFRNIWAIQLPEREEPGPDYAAAAPIQLTPEELESYAGTYDRPNADAPITITRQDDQLVADFYYRPGVLELVPVEEHVFDLKDTAGQVVFEMDESGTPTALTFHLGGAEIPATRSES